MLAYIGAALVFIGLFTLCVAVFGGMDSEHSKQRADDVKRAAEFLKATVSR